MGEKGCCRVNGPTRKGSAMSRRVTGSIAGAAGQGGAAALSLDHRTSLGAAVASSQRLFGADGPQNPPPPPDLPGFLPGRLLLRHGTSGDYARLACFHYRTRPPATWAAVLAIDHASPRQPDAPRAIAVGVLSWPTAVSRARQAVFGLRSLTYGQQIHWANANVRTISRVIVHPQFRGLGLARLLVQELCRICPTRYVEATASMGAAHPLFWRAGMTGVGLDGSGPTYFWLDRHLDALRRAPRIPVVSEVPDPHVGVQRAKALPAVRAGGPPARTAGEEVCPPPKPPASSASLDLSA